FARLFHAFHSRTQIAKSNHLPNTTPLAKYAAFFVKQATAANRFFNILQSVKQLVFNIKCKPRFAKPEEKR
ncbi:MAG: hypothetical protein SPI56_07130, partial [Alloprevotella sp.]|nr:hypothetical protein [Alloprevotella sp.]